jgi:hypothetical protein
MPIRKPAIARVALWRLVRLPHGEGSPNASLDPKVLEIKWRPLNRRTQRYPDEEPDRPTYE